MIRGACLALILQRTYDTFLYVNLVDFRAEISSYTTANEHERMDVTKHT